jgi:ComF family protein
MTMFDAALNSLFSVVTPRKCAICASGVNRLSDGNACADCWAATEIYSGNEAACRKCGLVLPSARSSGDPVCWQCDGHFYDSATSIGPYAGALEVEVIGLKTVPKISSRTREYLFNAFLNSRIEGMTLIVPVPLSRQRQRERGFNQAEVIAKELAETFRITVDARSLVRGNHSPIHRVGMDRKARDLSVKNAFSVVRPKLTEGQAILLVDDVYTTGATLSYCAKALKRYGAFRVDVLTLARAIWTA